MWFDTGNTELTEKELKVERRYRKMLSEKNNDDNKPIHQFLLSQLISITKKLNLPKDHPQVVESFEQKLKECVNKYWFTQVYKLKYLSFPEILKMVDVRLPN